MSELPDVQPGEVLVVPATRRPGAGVRPIAATVSEVGGIMSHTASSCREYGMPAVVGTGNAVATLRTGRGSGGGGTGVVTLLDGP